MRFVPTTWVSSIDDRNVTLYDVHTGETRTHPVDAVILSTARVPVDGLARELAGKVTQLFTIGDALAARFLGAATFEGHMFARQIGEPVRADDLRGGFFPARCGSVEFASGRCPSAH